MLEWLKLYTTQFKLKIIIIKKKKKKLYHKNNMVYIYMAYHKQIKQWSYYWSFKSTIEKKNHLIGHKNGIWWKIPFLCRQILFKGIVCDASFFQTLYNVMIWRIVLLNKADLHDITEILLKVAFNTIKQTNIVLLLLVELFSFNHTVVKSVMYLTTCIINYKIVYKCSLI